jgi:hypothetical protein
LVDGEDLSQFLMTPHFHDTIRQTLYCLIEGILGDLHIVHDNIYLGLLINIFSHLHDAVSCKLNCVFHVLIHLTFIAYKYDMGHTQYVENNPFIKSFVNSLSRLNAFAIKDKNLFKMSLLYVAFNINKAAIDATSASSS